MTAPIITIPDDPAAFWRGYFKIAKRVAVLKRRCDYAIAHWSPDTKARSRRIAENLKVAQAILKAYCAEKDRRFEAASPKIDPTFREFERFMAPLRYMRRPRFVRADEDGFYKTGRIVNGLPEVRRVLCPK